MRAWAGIALVLTSTATTRSGSFGSSMPRHRSFAGRLPARQRLKIWATALADGKSSQGASTAKDPKDSLPRARTRRAEEAPGNNSEGGAPRPKWSRLDDAFCCILYESQMFKGIYSTRVFLKRTATLSSWNLGYYLALSLMIKRSKKPFRHASVSVF